MSESEIEKLIFFPPKKENSISNSIKNINVDIEKNLEINRKINKVSTIKYQEEKNDDVTKLRDNLLGAIFNKDTEAFTIHIEEYKKLKTEGIISSLGEPRLCIEKGTTLLRMAVFKEFDFAAEALLELCDTATIFKQHTINPEYIGGTVLHDAIANSMQKIITLLYEKITPEEFHALMSCKGTGTFFKDYFQGYELPLVIACWVGNGGIVKSLLHTDPMSIYIKDTNGYNLLHSLIIMCDEEREEVTNFTTMIYMMIYESEGGKVALQHLLEMKDNTNQTPMMLAIRKGEFRFAQLILDTVYKETVGKYGPASFVNFDITEIEQCSDTKALGMPGIIYLGTSSNWKRFPELLCLQPWKKLLKLRWDAYKWGLFRSTLIQVIILTWFAVVVTITPSVEELAELHNTTDLKRLAANESQELTFFEERGYFGTTGIVQFIGETLFILYGTMGFITEVFYILGTLFKLKRRMPFGEVLKRVANPVTGSLFYGITHIIFSVCMVLSFVSKAVSLDYSRNTTAAISIVCGFLSLTFFFRAFDFTSFFTVTVNKMLVGDVFRFIVIVSGYLFGFGTAFYILYKDTVGGPPSDMENYQESILTSYKLMLGLVDLKTMNVAYGGILVAFYVIYTILMTVMLFNMLIGIMANTINDTSEEKQYLGKLQRLSSTLTVESLQFWSKGFANGAIKKGKLKIKTEMFAGREQKRLFLECLEVEHKERFSLRKDPEDQKYNVLKRLKTPF